MAACNSLKITSFFKPLHNQHAELLGAGAGVDQNYYFQVRSKKQLPGMGDTRERESTGGEVLVGGEGNTRAAKGVGVIRILEVQARAKSMDCGILNT